MAAPAAPGNPPAILVAGPTASGKSALALTLARAFGGTIINADAMQTYRDLRILTARPTPEDEALVPHALYGVRAAADPGSVASWRLAALEAMRAARATGSVPILCGGTGLYFAALTQGLAEIPDAGASARAEARAFLADIGAADLHALLAAADPDSAARVRPTDGQRVARAWEVWRGTGKGLVAWQSGPALPPAPYRFCAVLLDPPRAALRTAIEARFAAMLHAGALAEVAALLGQELDPALPLMRAHGVPELSAHVRGDISLAEASARAISATAAYTKRQATWFRHHILALDSHAWTINARMDNLQQFSESILAELQNFLQKVVDAPHLPP